MTGKKQTPDVTPCQGSADGEPGRVSADLFSEFNQEALRRLLEAAARHRAEVVDTLAAGKRKRQRRVRNP